jgi:putative peptidoglycan lipid II flippase
VLRRFGHYSLAAIPASVAGVLVGWPLGAFTIDGAARSSEVAAAATMVLIAVVMTLVYAGALRAMRIPEFAAITDPVTRRLRRRR